MLDALPEGYEVVDGGYGRDERHVIHTDHGDEIERNDEPSDVPVAPAVSEDGGDDGGDLDDGFEFAEVAGLDGEAFGGCDGAEPADEEFAADDEDGDPGLDDVRVVFDESDVGGGDEQLVGQGVEEHAHGGNLAAAAG